MAINPVNPSQRNGQPSRDDTNRMDEENIEKLESEPNVERGERLDSGKTIARGGKETGHVPGAEATPDK